MALRQRSKDSSEFKRQVFYALENIRQAKVLGKAIGVALFVLIVLNAAVVFVSVQPGLDPVASHGINVFYALSTICFAVEYFARIWVADLACDDASPLRARMRYAVSPLGLIDLLSFLPSMIGWFIPVSSAFRDIINVLRLIRLLKISRYMRGFRTIGRVVRMRRHEIVAALLVIILLIVVSSVVMYEIENPAQPTKFNSLLSGVYWAVTTVSGTGYGDLAPITPAGRVVGSIIMLLSLGLAAIPGGILAAGFVAEFQNAKLQHVERDARRSAQRGQRSGEAGPAETCKDARQANQDGS